MHQKGRRHRAKKHNREEKREEANSNIPSDRAVGPYTPAPAGGCAGTDPEGGDKRRARVTSRTPCRGAAKPATTSPQTRFVTWILLPTQTPPPVGASTRLLSQRSAGAFPRAAPRLFRHQHQQHNPAPLVT